MVADASSIWTSAAIVLALGWGSAYAQGSAQEADRSGDVGASVRALADAMHRRDRRGLEQWLAPDFVLRSAPDIDRDTWIHNALALCWGEHSDIEGFAVRQHGDTAIASFELTGYVDPETCRHSVWRSLVTDVWTRDAAGWRLRVRHAGPPPSSDAIAAQYGTKPAPPPAFEIDGEMSLVATGGNVSTRTLGVGGGATHRAGIRSTALTVAFVTSRAEHVTQAQSVTTELRHGIRLRERLELFGRAAYGRDRFAGIDRRFTGDAGVAYALSVPRQHSLTTEGSIGFVTERRLDASRPRFISVAGTVKYRWTIASGTQLAETIGLVADAETARDWRGTNTVAVTVAVTRLLSLKVSNAVEYRHLPVAGFLRATASPVNVPAPFQASV